MLRCILFEDDDLLVVNKPAGMNTHAPSPFAGEGIYEWFKNRERRWASLAIIHRLDKETSGVLLFSKTTRGNQSLTAQFARRSVHKKYLLLTDRVLKTGEFTVSSSLARVGDRYASRSHGGLGEPAETKFKYLGDNPVQWNTVCETKRSLTTEKPLKNEVKGFAWMAEPLTGRTHQIRVHASEKGLPILGDPLYGGAAAARLYLHAAELTVRHPVTGLEMTFPSPPDFDADPTFVLRKSLIEPALTNACRLVHGASDRRPKWYVDRLGDYLLSQSENSLGSKPREELMLFGKQLASRGGYHKILRRRLGGISRSETAPQPIFGEEISRPFVVRENGLQFELSFSEGYSAGLFLDQRDNRRRLLTGYVAPGFELFSPESAGSRRALSLLNTFSYTCGFSVCAAKAGIRTTNVDLSTKYLEWGERNFKLNGITAEDHSFICGDVFDELKRLGKKGVHFNIIVLDPPTFSQSKKSGPFRVEKDYGKLIGSALRLLKANGVLLASTNAANWQARQFVDEIQLQVRASGRKPIQEHFVPQPPDFPVSRAEPGYLKTIWLRLA